MTEGTTIASLQDVATGIASIAAWFWGIFGDFIEVIMSNDLILWPVILAIVSGLIGLAIVVIRKFGLKGRR